MNTATKSNSIRALAPLGRRIDYEWRHYKKQSHWRFRIAILATCGLSLGSIIVVVLS